MSSGLTIKKSLIGKEDVLFGRGGVEQHRGGKIYNISKIVMTYPVQNLSELKSLDPLEFDTSVIIGEKKLIINPDGTLRGDECNNEFYYYDFQSEADEDFPNVIKSSVTEFGRWKLAKIGEDRILKVVDDAVKTATENIQQEILEEVTKIVEETIPEAIAENLIVVKRKGGLYDSNITYFKGDFVRIFVQTDLGVEERAYMVKKETTPEEGLVNTPPVNGNKQTFGTIEIYQAQGLTENTTDWFKLFVTKPNKLVQEVSDSKLYTLFDASKIVQGTMKVRAIKGSSVTAYFEVIFSGCSNSDFSIRNVQYAKIIRQSKISTSSNLGQIFYPGFAIHSKEGKFGISVDKTNQVDKFEIDFSDLNYKPTPSLGENFTRESCYAIREGGGSYIQRLGMVDHTIKYTSAGTSGDSYDFYLFMNGLAAWSTATLYDTTIYHQFANGGFASTNVDVSDAVFRNVGAKSGSSVGARLNPQLPEITSKVSAVEGNDKLVEGNILTQLGDGDVPPDGWRVTADGAFSFENKRLVNNASYWGNPFYRQNYTRDLVFKASRSNPIYSVNGDVRGVTLVAQVTLQLF